MPKFHSVIKQESGVPLGGLGTGSIELRPDGEFHEWQIANAEQFSKDCREIQDAQKGDSYRGSLSFYVRTQAGEEVVLRRLGHGFGSFFNHEEYNYRMFSFNKTVESIDYTGTFPVTQLCFHDDCLPVGISMEALSPFVPYDERTSATPGFAMKFHIVNHSDKKVRVSLISKLKNLFGEDIKPKNSIARRNDAMILTIDGSDKSDRIRPDNGSISLSLAGNGEISYLSGEYEAYMDEYVSHGSFGISEESFLFRVFEDGALPNTDLTTEPEGLAEWENLSDEEIDRLFCELSKTPFVKSVLHRVLHTENDILESAGGRRALLQYVVQNILEMKKKGKWGAAALCIDKEILPGDTVEQTFVFTWHFPNLVSASGNYVGHMYANWFKNSSEVQAFFLDHLDPITTAAKEFRDQIYHACYPEVYSDAVSIQLANLVKSSWWSDAGDFGIWEGLGSCGLATMDITYHGTFGLVQLFPSLQKKQMLLGAKFQRADGRVYHFFTPDFLSVDDGYDRVDMNSQFVLLVYRDYAYTGDLQYAKTLWPNVKAAMKSMELLDGNRDGLPDLDTCKNTYDAWNFSGTSAYISLLWLAALKAAVYLAKKMDDPSDLSRWEQMLKLGTDSIDRLLWNGEYYNLWIDGDNLDECCMTDQLDGEYFARLTGLGAILPDHKVRMTLEFIFRNNYSADRGLVNASYPSQRHSTLFTYHNCQADANWSGIEYAMAAFYILMGDEKKGRCIAESVDARYRRIGQVWNHQECGDHYDRPLSSFCLLTVLSGISLHLADKRLRILPSQLGAGTYAPWFSSKAYGTANYEEGGLTLWCKRGSFRITNVKLLGGLELEKALVHNQEAKAVQREDNIWEFIDEICIKEGECLTLLFR